MIVGEIIYENNIQKCHPWGGQKIFTGGNFVVVKNTTCKIELYFTNSIYYLGFFTCGKENRRAA